jgi:hypothetical protein
MEKAFITRAPNKRELDLFSKYLGSYRDGTGNYKEKDGSSRADSRQIERCFAELCDGVTTENKSYYDFVIETNENGAIAVRGASIKSKEIKKLNSYRKNLGDLRAHLEISNSAAKDWALCHEHGLTENDLRKGKHIDKFGEIILQRQIDDRTLHEKTYVSIEKQKNKVFISRDSVFISVLYSESERGERNWLISSFSIHLPKPKRWTAEGRRIAGLDENNEVIYEWYALSGSQFKYYPKVSTRLHGTDLFQLPKPATETLRAKSNRLFGI